MEHALGVGMVEEPAFITMLPLPDVFQSIMRGQSAEPGQHEGEEQDCGGAVGLARHGSTIVPKMLVCKQMP